jgi:hypothetical protein
MAKKDRVLKSISTIFLFSLSPTQGGTAPSGFRRGWEEVNKWTCKQTLALKYLPVKIASLVNGMLAASLRGPGRAPPTPPPLKNLIGHSTVLPLKKFRPFLRASCVVCVAGTGGGGRDGE